MNLISLFFGILLLLLGIGYLYRPSLIYRFNLLVREYLFNDRLLLAGRRKIGVFLMLAGALVLFFAL